MWKLGPSGIPEYNHTTPTPAPAQRGGANSFWAPPGGQDPDSPNYTFPSPGSGGFNPFPNDPGGAFPKMPPVLINGPDGPISKFPGMPGGPMTPSPGGPIIDFPRMPGSTISPAPAMQLPEGKTYDDYVRDYWAPDRAQVLASLPQPTRQLLGQAEGAPTTVTGSGDSGLLAQLMQRVGSGAQPLTQITPGSQIPSQVADLLKQQQSGNGGAALSALGGLFGKVF